MCPTIHNFWWVSLLTNRHSPDSTMDRQTRTNTDSFLVEGNLWAPKTAWRYSCHWNVLCKSTSLFELYESSFSRCNRTKRIYSWGSHRVKPQNFTNHHVQISQFLKLVHIIQIILLQKLRIVYIFHWCSIGSGLGARSSVGFWWRLLNHARS